ncbi:hypothetical protein [Lyngbya aestuarii]|uniref:hypothetical protein n=1 Tax=Lyngbya aestuarii TaxID=118322 RepID=UPI00403D8402
MTTENNQNNVPKERAIVEYSERNKEIVETNMPEASKQVQQETLALIEAIQKRAQTEARKAGEFTLEKYLEAVSTAQAEVEKMNLFEPEQIENSIRLMREEANKNWEAIAKDVTSLGDRLSDAAKAAWDALTTPRPDSRS